MGEYVYPLEKGLFLDSQSVEKDVKLIFQFREICTWIYQKLSEVFYLDITSIEKGCYWMIICIEKGVYLDNPA